jgi:hypothetical protein
MKPGARHELLVIDTATVRQLGRAKALECAGASEFGKRIVISYAEGGWIHGNSPRRSQSANSETWRVLRIAWGRILRYRMILAKPRLAPDR